MTRDRYLAQLRAVLNNTNQFVCFLSVAGDIGKNKVISNMRHYCKLLYNELSIEFTKRTIVMSTITISAVVSIHDDTLHSSCDFNSKLGTNDRWDNTINVVVDENSFIKRPDFEKLDKVLNTNIIFPVLVFLIIYRWYLLLTLSTKATQ